MVYEKDSEYNVKSTVMTAAAPGSVHKGFSLWYCAPRGGAAVKMGQVEVSRTEAVRCAIRQTPSKIHTIARTLTTTW